ncbi:hypothetical protein [Caudoviricetes sp.]|nr:hypothetical protein [Caudoviricetes sp.]UOF82745.1 hypothetical protein [Caudoviricetes sp.]
MSLSNAAEAALLDLLFLNTDFANIGDATGLRGSTAAGSYYVALYTADPGEAGTPTTNEATYTGYARKAVARSGAGFSRSVSTISNVAAVQFDTCTAGSNTITHWGLVTSSSGLGTLLISGALGSSINVSANIAPYFAIGALTATAD